MADLQLKVKITEDMLGGDGRNVGGALGAEGSLISELIKSDSGSVSKHT